MELDSQIIKSITKKGIQCIFYCNQYTVQYIKISCNSNRQQPLKKHDTENALVAACSMSEKRLDINLDIEHQHIQMSCTLASNKLTVLP